MRWRLGPVQSASLVAVAVVVGWCLLAASAYGSFSFLRAWHVGGHNDVPAPDGVAVDPARGVVYVSDFDGGIVQRFTISGRLLGSFGSDGTGPGQLDGPSGLAVDPLSGDVFVTEEALGHLGATFRVSVFSPSGRFIRAFGGPHVFSSPKAVSIDPASGIVYVADFSNSRVVAFDRDGRFLHVLVDDRRVSDPVGVSADPTTGEVQVSAHEGSGRFTTSGRRVAVLKRPADSYLGPVALDSITGDPLVVHDCDTCADSNSVRRYSPRERLVGRFSRPGSHGHQFVNGHDVNPTDSLNSIAADCGDVFVTEDARNRAEQFRRGTGHACPELLLTSVDAESIAVGAAVHVACIGPPGSPPCRGRITLGTGPTSRSRSYRIPANTGSRGLAVPISQAASPLGARVHVVAKEGGVGRPEIDRDVTIS